MNVVHPNVALLTALELREPDALATAVGNEFAVSPVRDTMEFEGNQHERTIEKYETIRTHLKES